MTATPSAFDQFEISGLTYFRCELAGPGILLMHELPGLSPACIDLGERLRERGFTVYMPLLFGSPGEHRTARNFLRLCVSREFHLFAVGKSSPVTHRLRALTRRIEEERPECGVGVIGMCLTGGFVLSMLADHHAIAGVVCQPSIPIPAWGARCAALSVSREDLDAAKANSRAHVLGLRFQRDILSPRQRMDSLQALLGHRFERIEIPSTSMRDHATLTDHYRSEEHKDHFERVVDFFTDRLEPPSRSTERSSSPFGRQR